MGKFIKTISESELKEGQMRHIEIGGTSIILYRLKGNIYATDEHCTHSACSLYDEGFIEGDKVVCGCHGGTFDIVSGRAVAFPATEDLKIYETKVSDGIISVKI
jgi:naphthalene 1,2-dioxygenase system ferredoxin subunit